MKTKHLLIPGFLSALQLAAEQITNPAIENSKFAKLTRELEPIRAKTE